MKDIKDLTKDALMLAIAFNATHKAVGKKVRSEWAKEINESFKKKRSPKTKVQWKKRKKPDRSRALLVQKGILRSKATNVKFDNRRNRVFVKPSRKVKSGFDIAPLHNEGGKYMPRRKFIRVYPKKEVVKIFDKEMRKLWQ